MAKSATGVAAPPNKRIGEKINSGKDINLHKKPKSKAKKGGKEEFF